MILKCAPIFLLFSLSQITRLTDGRTDGQNSHR